jgi:ABC-type uncharacterized transport system fused permease/ATPase subunit
VEQALYNALQQRDVRLFSRRCTTLFLESHHGGLIQPARAFGQVQGGLSWLIAAYAAMAYARQLSSV